MSENIFSLHFSYLTIWVLSSRITRIFSQSFGSISPPSVDHLGLPNLMPFWYLSCCKQTYFLIFSFLEVLGFFLCPCYSDVQYDILGHLMALFQFEESCSSSLGNSFFFLFCCCAVLMVLPLFLI